MGWLCLQVGALNAYLNEILENEYGAYNMGPSQRSQQINALKLLKMQAFPKHCIIITFSCVH